MIYQARCGHRGAHAFVDHYEDFDHSLAIPNSRAESIPYVDARRGLGAHPVHLDMPGAAQLCRSRAGGDDPHGPKKAIDPSHLHVQSVSHNQGLNLTRHASLGPFADSPGRSWPCLGHTM